MQDDFWPETGLYEELEERYNSCVQGGYPFSFMLNDICRAIEAKCNYLAALGILCHVESCGWIAAKVDSMKFSNDGDYFNYFFNEYMDCEKVNTDDFPIYGRIRSKLAHTYLIPGVLTFGVYRGSGPEMEIHKYGIEVLDSQRALENVIDEDGQHVKVTLQEGKAVFITVMDLFRQFVFGVHKLISTKNHAELSTAMSEIASPPKIQTQVIPIPGTNIKEGI